MEGRTTSSNAVTTALERARRHRGSAAAAALLAPLALGAMTSPAAATTTTSASISGSTASVGPVTTFTYNVSNLTGVAPLYQFELPELNAGDFNLGSFSGPAGWSAAEKATSQYSTTRFKDPSLTPGAYVLIA